ncbi:MAG: hypothetical protein MJ102_05230 [Clostridia bacterium]|nr:hypothetical protein [Clostridia bacterium]
MVEVTGGCKKVNTFSQPLKRSGQEPLRLTRHWRFCLETRMDFTQFLGQNGGVSVIEPDTTGCITSVSPLFFYDDEKMSIDIIL